MLVLGPASIFIVMTLFMNRSCEHKFEELDDYGAVQQFKFTDASGKSRNSSEFGDEIILINTLQSTCPDSCAILMWHLNQTIYQHIWKNKTKKRKKIRMLSFVTDGNGGPSSDLKTIEDALKDMTENYDPKLWILASGDAKKIYDLKSNNVSLISEENDYQELMLLIDKKHRLRMVLSGKVEGQIRRMKQSIALLHKQYDKQYSKER